MDYAATIPYSGGEHDETCDYCGCVFRVTITLQKGHNEREEYWCPECHKEFGTRASITPTVREISPRTDGRNNLYQNN